MHKNERNFVEYLLLYFPKNHIKTQRKAMIGNTLKLLTSPKAKGDKKTSKIPQTLHSNLAQSLRKESVANFSQLLSEAKEVKKSKNSSKIQKLSIRKKNEAPTQSTPIIPLGIQAPITQSIQNAQNTQSSSPHTPAPKTAKTFSKTRLQSTHEQLLLQKQNKAPQIAKKHIQPPLNEVLTQTRKPKVQKEQKTLRDVVKIAEEGNLNLTKLKLTSSTPKAQIQSPLTPRVEGKEEKKEVKVDRRIPEVLSNNTLKVQRKAPRERVGLESGVHKQEVSLQSSLPQAPIQEPQERERDFTLSDLLKASPKEKNITLAESKEEAKREEKIKESKPQELAMGELKRDTQLKINSSREALTQFSQRIREEVLNYKPPFSKLSMELNPVELGKLEITISKKGKELVINVNANNPNALHTFIQNQSEFRATLSNVGFSNVELNFSQGEGGEKNPQQEGKNQKRNKNSLEEPITEIPALASMEIKMVQYA